MCNAQTSYDLTISALVGGSSALFSKCRGEKGLFEWFCQKIIAEEWPVPTQDQGTALLGTK